MASALVLDPACDAVTAALRVATPLIVRLLNRDGSVRIYPDANGQVPERPVYPYISVEGVGETPLHTMGRADGPKWGGFARVGVRVGSQFRGDQEVRQLTSLAKQALEGQPLTLPGFGSASVTFEGLTVLEDVVAGITTREWVSEFEVLAHQS